jgi:pyruvate dehydrogenase E2 component (dihydrolipoamide acetyltransferase)
VAKQLDVTVPDLGDFHDVGIIEIAVKPGDSVRVDQPLLTLETDKATMDVPSPFAGVAKEVLVKVGDKVSKGSRIAVIEVGEAIVAPAAPKPAVAPAPSPPPSAPSPPASPDVAPPILEVASDVSAEPRKPASGKTPAPDELGKPTSPPPLEVMKTKAHAGPSIRRLARELGVDLTLVKGTGRHGRIVEQDVKSYVKDNVGKAVQAGGGFVLPELPFVDYARFGLIESQPLSRIKRVTATNLHRAWLRVVHVTQHDEADITDLEAFRKSESVEMGTLGGSPNPPATLRSQQSWLAPHASEAKQRNVKLTMLPFIMKAVVATLKAFPTFNASLDPAGENLILKRYYHIGIAVDTPEGLVVPVIRDVERKGVFDLAGELALVSEKARAKKLMPGDMQGGSFTISSLGGIGGTSFTPIVNAPEVAILGVSRASLKPVWQSGAFVPRLMLPLSLSYDHRVNDGAEAARFTSYLRQLLSDIKRLLL